MDAQEVELRKQAAAGKLIAGWEASYYLNVQQGTIRVWTHRGKLTVAAYSTEGAFEDPQPVAMYRLSDVIALADTRGGINFD